MSVFSNNATPAQLTEMFADVEKLGKADEFKAALAAEGLSLSPAPDHELAALHARHGIAHGLPPSEYEITWRNPDAITPAEHAKAKEWLVNTGMPPGLGSSIVGRVEELAPGIAALPERDRAERIAKTKAQVGGEESYGVLLQRARAVLQSGGEFKFSAAAEALIAVDSFTLTTLARVQDANLALKAAIDKRGAK